MATPKSKTGVRNGTGRWVLCRGRKAKKRRAEKSASTIKAFFIGPDQILPKGTAGFKLKVPDAVAEVPPSRYKRIRLLLPRYRRPPSFRGDDDETNVTAIEKAVAVPEQVVEDAMAPELLMALATARERGRRRAAEILGGDDMLNADAFAEMLGTTHVAVDAKRQSGQILGLNGAKQEFRFPVWQLDAERKPYTVLAVLHEHLGGPWAVYRFLIQPHGELNGLTGREALERGKVKAALKAAESVGRDFR